MTGMRYGRVWQHHIGPDVLQEEAENLDIRTGISPAGLAGEPELAGLFVNHADIDEAIGVIGTGQQSGEQSGFREPVIRL